MTKAMIVLIYIYIYILCKQDKETVITGEPLYPCVSVAWRDSLSYLSGNLVCIHMGDSCGRRYAIAKGFSYD
jgi:hypothetical protein